MASGCPIFRADIQMAGYTTDRTFNSLNSTNCFDELLFLAFILMSCIQLIQH